MKLILTIVMLFTFELALANTSQLSCTFQNHSEKMILENCAEKLKDNSIKIKSSVLKKIKFDEKGLAGGSIQNEGCHWLNKKGVLRKTHCFDNGSDSYVDGLARYVDSKGQFGYMDQKLKIKISAQYTFAFPFESGFAKVCMNCQAEKTQDSEHSLMKGGQWMIIDKKGHVVKNCPADVDGNNCHPPVL